MLGFFSWKKVSYNFIRETHIYFTLSLFRGVMKCLTNPNAAPDVKKPGVMIPIPQYPLYSASLAGKWNHFHGKFSWKLISRKKLLLFFLSSEYNMHQIGYYLDEDKNWSLDMDVLEKAYQDATEVCNPRYFGLIFYSILFNFTLLYSFFFLFQSHCHYQSWKSNWKCFVQSQHWSRCQICCSKETICICRWSISRQCLCWWMWIPLFQKGNF